MNPKISLWATRIFGALLVLALIGSAVMYTRYLRHAITDLQGQVQVLQISEHASVTADKVYTAKTKITNSKNTKAKEIIDKAVATNPEEANDYFPDDLADALRDPASLLDAPAQRVPRTDKAPTARGSVSTGLPDNLPAVEVAR